MSQNQHLSPEERQRLEEESKPWYDRPPEIHTAIRYHFDGATRYQRYMWYIIIGLAVMFLMPSAPDAASDKPAAASGGSAAARSSS